MPILGFGKSREEKEIERDIEARQGRRAVQRYVKKQKELLPKLWEMGKEALRLQDPGQFRLIVAQYVWTRQQVTRWERWLLTFDMVQARRDQARSTREFLSSLQAMGRSMISNADPQDMLQMQKDLQLGLARAQAMEDRMNLIMETADDVVYDLEDIEDADLEGLRQAMEKELVGEETESDLKIAEGLKEIEERMRRELGGG